ncbi:MAG TPA: bifunctional adenosylcobinamide kinase/adenosylcobinamide-phosphate guanylyltransferase [Gemmataceae bacterium]|nr:bifunctional adenosylcobinamide kinase/adenosylcobinamide-phosphate guanylyltransferase [Gemmataceae bacterium]
MAHLTLIVGGIRSGKSRFAEQVAVKHAPVTYLATAAPPPSSGPDPGDDSMSRRIARHRQRRAAMSPPWQTIEEPWDVPAVIRAHGNAGCVLVECLTLWVSNLMLGLPGRAGLADEGILAEVTKLAEAGQEVPARVVVVSNEVGCGIIPMDALARRYGDLLGEANQKLAALATEVYGCLAGIPLLLQKVASG